MSARPPTALDAPIPVGRSRDDLSFGRRFVYWLQPRWRDPGWLAFALNRVSGHILVLYLIVHLVVLGQLAAGPSGWDRLLEIFGSRPFLVGDTLLIAAVAFHGLNGLRVMALTFGFGTRHSAALFALVVIVAGLLTGLAGWAILG